MSQLTVEQITAQLRACDREGFGVLERSLVADTRKGVKRALRAARARLDAEDAEAARLESLFAFEAELRASRDATVSLGLDEVGRGPIAGPVAVGGVVLPPDARIPGLNDSKQLSAEERERIAEDVRACALAWTVQFASALEVDALGIAGALRMAFCRAIEDIASQGQDVGVILLDGNPMRLDERELNVVKGDARVASIAAASVIAKVARDALMRELDAEYPGYGFAQHKGYGTESHRQAIRELGLSPVHRVSFCGELTQPSLF